MVQNDSESKSLQLIKKLTDYSIDGIGPLTPATKLAQEYLIDISFDDLDKRVDALIRWESSKNFGSGLVTGLGGFLTLPVTVPSALGASWIIQARMCGAIAALYGHKVKNDRVRTLVLLSLLGDAAKEALKEVGVKAGQKLSLSLIQKVPGKALIEINKKIGFRLLTKAGQKGIVNLSKMVPIVGGIMGGTFDATSCVAVGKIAKESFRPYDIRKAHTFDRKGICKQCKENDIEHRRPSKAKHKPAT